MGLGAFTSCLSSLLASVGCSDTQKWSQRYHRSEARPGLTQKLSCGCQVYILVPRLGVCFSYMTACHLSTLDSLKGSPSVWGPCLPRGDRITEARGTGRGSQGWVGPQPSSSSSPQPLPRVAFFLCDQASLPVGGPLELLLVLWATSLAGPWGAAASVESTPTSPSASHMFLLFPQTWPPAEESRL